MICSTIKIRPEYKISVLYLQNQVSYSNFLQHQESNSQKFKIQNTKIKKLNFKAKTELVMQSQFLLGRGYESVAQRVLSKHSILGYGPSISSIKYHGASRSRRQQGFTI